MFGFISSLIDGDDFWSDENAKQRDDFIANRHSVVGSIARLVEAGCKSDEHAFSKELNGRAKSILATLLNKQPGEDFSVDCDAVSVAINSARGQCLEALINLTLRACRLQNRSNSGVHASAWKSFEDCYDKELDRPSRNEFEFATLVTNYLPNFLYMSREWVHKNLPRIFDQGNYLRWLCAMQGYSFVGTVYQEIYSYLRDNGDLMKSLDDGNLKKRVDDRVVQQIVVAYINDFEALDGEGSLLQLLLMRKDFVELKQLVWCFWTLRKDDDENLREKALALWPTLLSSADTRTLEGRQLVSALAYWTVFVDKIDQNTDGLLRAVAPFSDEDHNSYYLLEGIARLSNEQPFEANAIWQEILKGTAADYPEEAVRNILSNLCATGRDGVREAKKTVSTYLSIGVERPAKLLEEILNARAEVRQ